MTKHCFPGISKTIACTITGFGLCFLGGCSSEADNVTSISPYATIEVVELAGVQASGFVEKGPFVTGSSLKLFEVHGAKLSQTGKSYTGKLKSDDGSFSITASKLQSQYAIIEATGYYKNEISGFNSNGPLTLTAFVDLKDRHHVNVNLLTHLEYERILALHETGMNFPSAKNQAASEIFATFGFEGEFGEPEDFTIFGKNEGDAALLAVSVLMQGNRKEADMSELIARIANEIGETGAWEDMKQKTAIADWAFGADLESIRSNVESWDMGKVPNFEKYVEMFWRYVYGLEACTSKNEGALQVIENEYSKNKGQVLVCKIGSWQEATFDDVKDTSDIVPTPSVHVGDDEVDYSTITDSRDGKVYKVVTIGDQVWMAENLNYKTSTSRCARSDCDNYGRLYPWSATKTNICPDGWRVPTNSEWEKLYAYVDKNNGDEPIETSLKSKTTWVTPGSDRFGFKALSAGYYWNGYSDIGLDAAWWSSSEDNYNQGYDWRLYHGANYDDLGMPKSVEFSIRCIKKNGSSSDEEEDPVEETPVGSSSSSEDVVLVKSSSSEGNETPVRSSSSINVNPIVIGGHYDCSEYNCVTTEYLNQDMLAAGMYGEFLDTRDNQVYRTVTIGTQTWMAQNLNYATEESQCLKASAANCSTYGRLYTQSEAQSVCPAGWHLPSNAEWNVLNDYVDDRNGSEGVGNSLKSLTWTYGERGTDRVGFSGLAGQYFGSVLFCGSPTHGTYWTSDAHEYRCLLSDNPILYYYMDSNSDTWGMSVRCLLNGTSSVPVSSSSVTPRSSSSAIQQTLDTARYDCSIYNCRSTEYLNQEMLAAGKYGELLDTRDNQVYRTVTIGTQTWMAQNLNYNASGSQCYDGISSNCDVYGRLYYWSAISASEAPDQGVLQGSCPAGWHVPSDDEYLVLLQYVGENRTDDIQMEMSSWPTYYSYENSAMALKSATYHWKVAGSGDKYGFSAIPSGDRWDYGSYANLGTNAVYWTSTISDVYWGPRAITRRIENTEDYVTAHWDLLDYMFAIRCIKNGSSSTPVSSSSVAPRSSSSAIQQTSDTAHYDCSIYNCRPTEHLNQTMLAAGKYGELLDTRDNQVYRTTKICNQVWMAQNLNYLPVTGTTYCYDDINSYCTKYGRLYVRAAVSCPAGWHLPDDSEWQELFSCVGGQSIAADALRASSGWDAHPELNSADEYGFSSLPAGVYYFGDEGNTGWYLSDTGHNDFSVGVGAGSAKSTAADYTAISVRCVQD